MERDRALNLLVGYQHDIRELLIEWERLLEPGAGDCPSLVAALRWKLLRVLRAYQLFKHREIFDPLARSDISHIAQSASRLKQQCTKIGLAYTDYIKQWSGNSVASEANSYLSATRQIISWVKQHLNTECSQVRALMRDVPDTRSNRPTRFATTLRPHAVSSS